MDVALVGDDRQFSLASVQSSCRRRAKVPIYTHNGSTFSSGLI